LSWFQTIDSSGFAVTLSQKKGFSLVFPSPSLEPPAFTATGGGRAPPFGSGGAGARGPPFGGGGGPGGGGAAGFLDGGGGGAAGALGGGGGGAAGAVGGFKESGG